MTVKAFDKLKKRDFENGVVLDEIRTALKHLQRHRNALDIVFQNLKQIEQNCPCGARPETRHTHGHVVGCPVDIAIIVADNCRQECGLP